jgi:hypothetical protein
LGDGDAGRVSAGCGRAVGWGANSEALPRFGSMFSTKAERHSS